MSQSNPSLTLAEPLFSEEVARKRCSGKVLALVALFTIGMGCAGIWSQGQQVDKPAINANAMGFMAKQPSWAQVGRAGGKAFQATTAAMNRIPTSSPLAGNALSAVRFAALDGARTGCRGQLTCVRAVGLFFGTQTGKTEEAAGAIATEAGVEAQAIDDIAAADLAGFDGLIVGAPTWHTGADEQRSGTGWDDYLDEIRGLDLGGKPVAVFGTGDSAGYGDNFCDAIEELHSTFAAAGAKMVGYTDASGYQHTESKSDQDGKFVGLPLDQDNEDDMTEDRVKKWVAQIKSEGMPLE